MIEIFRFDTLVSVGQYCPYSGRGQVKELRQVKSGILQLIHISGGVWVATPTNQTTSIQATLPSFWYAKTLLINFGEVFINGYIKLTTKDGTNYDACGLRLVNRQCGSGTLVMS